MRRCEVCSSEYDESVDLCPLDGRSLDPFDPFVGQLVDGKYRVEAAIGSGAMGSIYRATQLNLDRTVALKILRGGIASQGKTAERFKREALAVARLKHPHIVTIYDFGVAPELGAYLVMEYLEGHSLQTEIRERGCLSVPLAAELMRQVCSAVHVAHSAGVIHRDLKPQNIHLEPVGTRAIAKVLDFGVAKLQVGGDSDVTALTASGAMLGTPLYISPEQCSDLPLDARSDVYSLGCVLYEMLTGRPPFVGPSVASVLVKQMGEPPKPPGAINPEIPAELDTVLLRALAKRPAERYQSAAELGYALAPFEEHPSARTTGELATIGRSTVDTPLSLAATTELARELPTNLPRQVTGFIGRDAQVAGLVTAIGAARLVLVVGLGGVGKTRLAIEAADRLLHDFPDGVWFVEIGALGEAAEIAPAVAQTLGLPVDGHEATLSRLEAHARSRRLLLVLDGCEELGEACASFVQSLLSACPMVRILATSREPLGVAGERLWPLPPMELPAWRPGDRLEALLRVESVQLFVDRVRLNRSSFDVTEQNAPAILTLVNELDGLPMALELAATRARVLTIEQIVDRLDDRFRLLASGSRTLAPRHRSLGAVLDASYDLLGPLERRAVALLALFESGWSLPAAEAVFGDGRLDLLEVLTRLVERSLVVMDERAGEARYRMPRSVRLYALHRLAEHGEEGAGRLRHMEFYRALVDALALDQEGAERAGGLDRVDLELANIRAALRTSLRQEVDGATALQMAVALGPYWEQRGLVVEGRQWLEKALAHCGAAGGLSPSLRLRAHRWAGAFALVQADLDSARCHFAESARLALDAREERSSAQLLLRLCEVGRMRGDLAAADELVRQATEIFIRLDDRGGAADAALAAGLLAEDAGHFEQAALRFEESLAQNRALGRNREVALALQALGRVLVEQGLQERSERVLGEALEISERLGYRHLAASALGQIGWEALARGQHHRAATIFGEAMAALSEIGDRAAVLRVVEGFATLAAMRSRWDRAVRLEGAAAQVREELGLPRSPAVCRSLERALASARAELGPVVGECARSAGRAMTLEAAMALALEHD